MFAAQRAKDALVDRFRKREGKRPSVGKEQPDIAFLCTFAKGYGSIER